MIFLAGGLAPGGCTRTGAVLGPADGGAPVVLRLSEVRLSAGQSHACAITGGALRCWGDDGDGRLGVAPTGAGVGQGPVPVGGGPWLAPAAGGSHSCALATDGSVWCWGGNASGQLGTGDLVSSHDPRQVALSDKAVDVRTGFDTTCALLADASVWCWGANSEGQLGQGDTFPGQDHPLPVQVTTSRDWVFVATGQGHTCGIRAAGTLYCWGRNTDAELGLGATEPQQLRAPAQVGTDADWVEVSCGQETTCGRKRDGSLRCWGSMESGAVAVGDAAPRAVPTPVVPPFADWSSVDTNTFHTCGLRAAGAIWCAGRDTEGQIGSPDLADANPTLQQADPNPGWVEVRTGRFFTCARKADDSVWCMGTNTSHELGIDPAVTRSPTLVEVR